MFLTTSFVIILMLTCGAVAAILPNGVDAMAARPPSDIAASQRLRNTELTDSSFQNTELADSSFQSTELADSSFSNRHKRAIFVFRIGLNLVQKGMNAMEFLLRGATPIPSHTAVRQYQKLGSYQQALKDFDSVNPFRVRPFEIPGGVYGKVGQVGDRSLVVKNSDGYGNPVIEILQVKGVTISDGKRATATELTDKISYVHKLCKSDCDE